jgi:hypothetical protein
MKKEINKSDINKMNQIIFKKINEQFEKDLTPSEFIATSRLALAFQKAVEIDLVNEEQQEESRKAFNEIMGMLDQVAAFKANTPGFEFEK